MFNEFIFYLSAYNVSIMSLDMLVAEKKIVNRNFLKIGLHTIQRFGSNDNKRFSSELGNEPTTRAKLFYITWWDFRRLYIIERHT